MKDKPNYAAIQQIARENVVVHKALQTMLHSEATYEEALEIAVIQLAAQVDLALKSLTDMAMRAPPAPIVLNGTTQTWLVPK